MGWPLHPGGPTDQRRNRMASRHGLLASATSASPSTGDLAACLVGLHSSDPVTVYLTVAARNDSATVDSVRNELDHLVRHHAMRRTLWVFNRSTATVAHAALHREDRPG